jgi:hypothetical protein
LREGSDIRWGRPRKGQQFRDIIQQTPIIGISVLHRIVARGLFPLLWKDVKRSGSVSDFCPRKKQPLVNVVKVGGQHVKRRGAIENPFAVAL